MFPGIFHGEIHAPDVCLRDFSDKRKRDARGDLCGFPLWARPYAAVIVFADIIGLGF